MSARGPPILAVMLAVLATTSGTAAAKPVFGVVPQDGGLPTPEDLELMPDAGIGGIRLIASWASVERSRGIYDWGGLDAVVRETSKLGIQPLLVFYGTPEWAAHADGHACSGDACVVFPPWSDATRTAFATFVGAAAQRYGRGGYFWEAPSPNKVEVGESGEPGTSDHRAHGVPTCDALPICPPPPLPPTPPPASDAPGPGEPLCGCTEPRPITTWQIWNEQNYPPYHAPEVSVGRYARMLQVASAAIRTRDPAAEIVLGGMWGPRSFREVLLPVRAYLQRLYRIPGIEASFDAIAVHPYAPGAKRSLGQMEVAHNVARRAGDRRVNIWITELGWSSAGPKEHPLVKGLKGQARLLERTFSKVKRRASSFRLRGVFWYSWRDKYGGNQICGWCGHSGLLKKNGAPKPAWRAFVRAARS